MGKDGYRSPQTGGVLDRIAPVVTLIGALLSTAGFVLAFTLAGPVNGATVIFDVYSGTPDDTIGTICFTLVPADNENGFTIAAKSSDFGA